MTELVIKATTSDAAEESAKTLRRGGFVATKARINYNTYISQPKETSFRDYPLVIEGKMDTLEVSLYFYNVSAGYGGSGPHAMCAILKEFGFDFNEDDILTKKKMLNGGLIYLTYEK